MYNYLLRQAYKRNVTEQDIEVIQSYIKKIPEFTPQEALEQLNLLDDYYINNRENRQKTTILKNMVPKVSRNIVTSSIKKSRSHLDLKRIDLSKKCPINNFDGLNLNFIFFKQKV